MAKKTDSKQIAMSQTEAASLLVTPTALGELNIDDAKKVIAFMRPKQIPEGTAFIKEGESAHTDYMLLVLRGDVIIEGELSASRDNLIVSVMGPGSLIGEMGILDAAPRSATCIAATDVTVAVLSREDLKRLMEQQPKVAARFLMAVSTRLAERLRETTRKLKSFSQVNRALQEELNSVMNSRTGTSLALNPK
jgi:CRP/FNR family transcriptional regulator, cyclic AMP receptor protein